MALGIALCGIILSMHLMVSIFVLAKTTMSLQVFAFLIGVLFFDFILSIASILMNQGMIKKKRRKRSFVGLYFSIATTVLCLLLAVFLVLVRQRWIVFDYRFLTDNRASIIINNYLLSITAL